MREYKVNRDPNKSTVPSKEQIDKHKDFATLSHKYEKLTKRPKKPLYKDPKLFIALVVIVIVAYLITEVIDKDNDKQKDKQEQKDEQSNAETSGGTGCAMCKEKERPKYDPDDIEKKSRFD